MSLNRTLQTLKLASLLGGIVGLGVGCLITVSPLEPCDSGSNNKLNDAGECECRIGYEWCNPEDVNDLNCCDDGSATTETTGPGDGDPTTTGDGDPTTTGDGDPTTTGDGDGDPGTGDGDGDPGTGDCGPVELPPDSCSEDEEGFFWCTNLETDPEGPCGSELYICQGGAWVLNTEEAQLACEFDGFDFPYGCVDNGEEVVFECGDGPGTDCLNTDPATCVDMDIIGYCLHEKLTHDSCQLFCEEVGIDGQTYEIGECDDADPNDVACFCYDS